MPKIQVRPKPKYDIASWRKNGADNFSNNWCIQRFTMPTELYFVLTVGDMEQRRSPYLQHHSPQRRFYSNDSENNSTENLPVQHWQRQSLFPKADSLPFTMFKRSKLLSRPSSNGDHSQFYCRILQPAAVLPKGFSIGPSTRGGLLEHVTSNSGISTMVEIIWTDAHYPILQAGQHYRIYRSCQNGQIQRGG